MGMSISSCTRTSTLDMTDTAGESLASGGSNSGGMQQSSGGVWSQSWGFNELSRGEQLFYPEHVSFNELTDEDEGVDVIAATLTNGAQGLEFYATLQNNGQSGACSGALSIELFNANMMSLGAFNGGIFAGQLYRINDLNQAITCIDPNEIGMSAIVDIGASPTLDQVAHLIYRFTYFNSDFFEGGLSSIDAQLGASIDLINNAAQDGLIGSLKNDLEVNVNNPSVIVFPTNGVRRPLGMISFVHSEPILAGTEWTFQMDQVPSVGEKRFTFLTGSIQF